MHPVVQELVTLVDKNGWQPKFEQAIENAAKLNVPALSFLTSFDAYINWLNDMVTWAPQTKDQARLVYDRITQFYFILDQDPVKELLSPVVPGKVNDNLTPLSQWILDFDNAWGEYLDTEPSTVHIQEFKDNPLFNWDDYMAPPSGYKTFNQFFARHVRPGLRPVAALCDPTVITAPADSTFVGWWQVNNNDKINSKGLMWSIQDLLAGSEYADAFKNGVFTHSFLNTNDYHRWHAPVPGKVLESRIIQGEVYLDITATPGPVVDGKQTHELSILDGTGYQFVQTRGLIVIDSPIGPVACVPMGMWPVDSVVITAEVGRTLAKGEELGYFAFGGSDFVMVFPEQANVHLDWQPGVHVRQGNAVGKAYPNTYM